MPLIDEYSKWLSHADVHLEEFEKKLLKVQYIELIKAHILKGHRKYKQCKALPYSEEIKIIKFKVMWKELNEIFETAYRIEVKGLMSGIYYVDAECDDDDNPEDFK